MLLTCSAWALLASACAATSPPPRPLSAHLPESHDLRPLPDDREGLLLESDRMAVDGPLGPDLTRSLLAAARLLDRDPADGEAAWRAARALFLSTTAASQESAAEIALDCMRVASIGVAQATRAEAPFFAALCMGARARARLVEGLGLVAKMLEMAELARARDPAALHAGPERLLGGIYLRAPPWPTSVGDPERAIEHLERAVAIAPTWAENHIMLAEAYLAEDRVADAIAATARARETLDLDFVRGWRQFWVQDLEAIETKLGHALH